MKSINSIGSSFGFGVSASGRSSGPAKAIEQEFSSYLQGQGLSDSQQASIKDELRHAIQSTLTSGSRPDPGKLKSTIQGVLDKHGVDGKAFTDKITSPRSSIEGLSNVGGPSKVDNLSQLLEILGEQSEKSQQTSRQSHSVDSQHQQSGTRSLEKLDIQA
jgi:hypothetical protein